MDQGGALERPDYQGLFGEMPGLVLVHDRELRVVDGNAQFRKRFSGAVGSHCWRVCQQRMTPCPECPVERTFRTGLPQSAQETIRTPAGEDVPVLVNTSPLRNGAGEVTHVLGTATDISEISRLQGRLHRAQQRFRQIFDESPCYISVQDRDLKLTAANRLFQEDFGDDIGAHCYEVYKHRAEPCVECPVMRTFEDGLSHSSEEIVTSASGDQYHVLVHTAPLRDASGEITQVMEMSTNITQIRRLEGQLADLGLLIGSISHGAKGLLTAIDGGTYIINSGLTRNDQTRVQNGWAIVQRNMRRLRSMVLDMLYYAKDRDLAMAPVNALELASEVWGISATRGEEGTIELENRFDVSAGLVRADSGALRTALVNFLENAIDACRLDRKKLRHKVVFGLESAPDSVIFRVEDNGLGMDRETCEKLFCLFFSSKGQEGTGLGLFISNKIVKQHGGRIEVSSTPDVGSCFRIYIPRELA